MLLGVFILAYACATMANELAMTVRTDVEVNAMQGDTVLLSCDYDCEIPPETEHTVVQWWRLRPGNDERIFLKNGGEISSATIQWAGNVTACNASIVMCEVKVKDSAKYRCEVIHLPSYTEGRSVVELRVSHSTDPTPVPTYARTATGGSMTVRTEAEVNAMEGDTVLLSCSYDCVIPPGNKHTVVQWWKVTPGNEERIFLKNGDEESSSNIQWAGSFNACNASIVMCEVEVKDSAKYRCEVLRIPSYTEGRSVVELHVSHSTKLLVHAPTETTVTVGNDIILNCSYDCKDRSDEHTLVEWWRLKDGNTDERILRKNGEGPTLDPRIEWRGDETSCNASISIARVQPEDAARYRCEVTVLPSYRKGRRVIQLNVRPQPDPPIQTTSTSIPTGNFSVEDEDTHSTVLTAILVPVGLIVSLIIAYVSLDKLCGHRFPAWIPLPSKWRRGNNPREADAVGMPLNVAS